jgi:hypothetical protein
MTDFSFLETTAEVSVSFAGFIGIFLALYTRDSTLTPSDSLTIRLIVITSVALVLYSAIPLLLFSLGVAGDLIWRVASGAMLLVGAAMTVYFVPILRSVPFSEHPAPAYGWPLAFIANAACLANMVGWPWGVSGGLYLLAVWSIVAIAAGNFVSLLYRRLP